MSQIRNTYKKKFLKNEFTISNGWYPYLIPRDKIETDTNNDSKKDENKKDNNALLTYKRPEENYIIIQRQSSNYYCFKMFELFDLVDFLTNQKPDERLYHECIFGNSPQKI